MTKTICIKLRHDGRDNMKDVQLLHAVSKQVSDANWDEATHIAIFAYGNGIAPRGIHKYDENDLAIYKAEIDKANSFSYMSTHGRTRTIKFLPSDQFWLIRAGNPNPYAVPKFNWCGFAILEN